MRLGEVGGLPESAGGADDVDDTGIGWVDQDRCQPAAVDLGIGRRAVLPVVFGGRAEGHPCGRSGQSGAARELRSVEDALGLGFERHGLFEGGRGWAAEELPHRGDAGFGAYVRIVCPAVGDGVEGEGARVDAVVGFGRAWRRPENGIGLREG